MPRRPRAPRRSPLALPSPQADVQDPTSYGHLLSRRLRHEAEENPERTNSNSTSTPSGNSLQSSTAQSAPVSAQSAVTPAASATSDSNRPQLGSLTPWPTGPRAAPTAASSPPPATPSEGTAPGAGPPGSRFRDTCTVHRDQHGVPSRRPTKRPKPPERPRHPSLLEPRRLKPPRTPHALLASSATSKSAISSPNLALAKPWLTSQ